MIIGRWLHLNFMLPRAVFSFLQADFELYTASYRLPLEIKADMNRKTTVYSGSWQRI